MKIIEDEIACYCLNAKCPNSIFRYQNAKVTYLQLEVALTSQNRCEECNSVLKTLVDLEIEEQVREILRY